MIQNSPSASTHVARRLGWFSLGLGIAEVVAAGPLSQFLGTKRKDLLQICGFREIATGVVLLASSRPASALWLRLAGDAVDLALIRQAWKSPHARRGNVSAALAVTGGITAIDLWAARAAAQHPTPPQHICRSITVNRPAAELYEWWRDPQGLGRIMGHVANVTATGETSTHWALKIPDSHPLSWDAEIHDDLEHGLLRWHAPPGQDIETDGTVRFSPAPGDRGTEVTLNFRFHSTHPGLAAAAAHLGMIPDMAAMHALRRFKSLVETGELPTLKNNPTARRNAAANLIWIHARALLERRERSPRRDRS